MGRGTRIGALLLVLLSLAAPQQAQAHWCNCLWNSAYNLVVRPDADSVNIANAGGSTTLTIRVQNNMGYPLLYFVLSAEADGFTITANPTSTAKVTDYLMPGEKQEITLTITRTGTTPSLDVESIAFYAEFGESARTEWDMYGRSGNAAVVRYGADIYPTALSLPGLGDGQGLRLQSSARADYESISTGLTSLLGEYCAGRDSWDGSGHPIVSYCPNDTTTVKPTTSSRNASTNKYDWQHLWAAGEIAYRKSALSAAQLTAFRERLRYGWDDEVPAFKAYATFLLGYVGSGDAATTSFLTEKASGTDANAAAMAKAALYMMGDDTRAADVGTALASSDDYVEMVCAAALSIVDGDDAAAEHLTDLARWLCPGDCDSTPQPVGLTASHILNVVAWNQRGWQPYAGDFGWVSFYEGGSNVAPKVPTGLQCAVGTSGMLGVSWSAVTQNLGDQPEVVPGYRLYWGTQAGLGANAQHSQRSQLLTMEPSGLVGGTTYYFAVRAVDAQALQSALSTEISCVAPTPPAAPEAVITCDQTNAVAPVTFTCQSASTDPNNDIAHTYFSLDGGVETEQTERVENFVTPSNHVLVLRVVDSTGREDTATQVLTAAAPAGGNQPPTAMAGASLTTGVAPLAVTFSSAGSSDPEGQTLLYAWAFGDGATSTDANPEHTFSSVGTYRVTLTVTDSGSPAYTGTNAIVITVTESSNEPPDTAAAVVSPTAGSAPLDVSFDATRCADPNGDAVTYQWTISESGTVVTTLNGATASYRFEAEGVYDVVLRATDSGQPPLSDERSYRVLVTDPGSSAGDGGTVQATCSCNGGSTGFGVVLGVLVALLRRRGGARVRTRPEEEVC